MQQTAEKGVAIVAHASGKTDLYISTYQFMKSPQIELAVIVYSFAVKVWSQSKRPTLMRRGTKG